MVRDKGSGSFLKKRTKKLLHLEYTLPNGRATAPDKSLLLLFFRKEGLSKSGLARSAHVLVSQRFVLPIRCKPT
jgi:hypothetical protein